MLNRWKAMICLMLLCLACERDKAPVGGVILTDAPLNMEMVAIPAGCFVMGNDAGPDDERPAHEVSLDAFYIGRTVVTLAQWMAVMGSKASEPADDGLPIVNVSWEEAQEFMARLSRMTGAVYRLPTEAEWEYACRAGSRTLFHFGQDTTELDDHAWYASNSGGRLHPVGMKQPNAWGLYDMAGNTWEWCLDWWDPGYYSRSPRHNPVNLSPYLYTSTRTGESILSHIARSGGFAHPPQAHESAHRHGNRPNGKAPFISFRCVREMER